MTINRTFAAAPAKTFGDRMAAVAPAAANRPEADVWLNIGYETGDPDYPIVTLPYGIPVDTQNPLKISGRDAKFLAFTGARNDLLKQVQDMAATLAPGDDTIIGVGGGLVIQIRRRAGEAVAPAIEDNPFSFELCTKAA